MNRSLRFLAVAASAGLAAVMLSLTSAGPALAQTFKPVMSFVINGPDNPVPVIDVGTSAVEEPIQRFVRTNGETSFTVPDGKRLIIEFYSGTSSSLSPCMVSALRITTELSGEPQTHTLLPVPVLFNDPSIVNAYTFSQQTRLYADPGTTVSFFLTTTPEMPDCGPSFRGVFSGHLIDVS
jgi:hypothetical protein